MLEGRNREGEEGGVVNESEVGDVGTVFGGVKASADALETGSEGGVRGFGEGEDVRDVDLGGKSKDVSHFG
jgi:hypothetical protein